MNEIEALRVAAERVPGVTAVTSHLTIRAALRAL
jgi:hypothetical protein